MADPRSPSPAPPPLLARPETGSASNSAPVRTVPMFNPEDGETREVAIDKVTRGQAAGLRPAWTPTEAALAGLESGATLDYYDELKGAAHAAPAALSAVGDAITHGHTPDFSATKDAYLAERDAQRQNFRDAHAQHPWAYNAGDLGGSAITGLALGAVSGGVGGLAAQGVAQGIGSSDAEDATGVAKDAALGGAGGVIGAGIGHGIGKTLGYAGTKLAPYLADRAVTQAAGITAKDLGRKEAAEVGRAAFAEPGLVAGNSGAKALAPRAEAARKVAGEALDRHYIPFDAKHGPTVNLRSTGEAIEQAAAPAVRTKPELARHVERAVRALHPEAYDHAVAEAVAERTHADGVLKFARQRLATARARLESLPVNEVGEAPLAAKFARHDAILAQEAVAKAEAAAAHIHGKIDTMRARPSTAFDPDHHVTLKDTQDAVNRMRELGAKPQTKGPQVTESLDEANARDDVLSPAWDATKDALKASVEQRNPAMVQPLNKAYARYSNLRALADGAQTAAGRGEGEFHIKDYKLPALALATGHPLVAAGGAGAIAAKHAATPRLAGALHAVGEGAKAIADAHHQLGSPTHKLTSTFGRFFAGKTPEQRQRTDFKLQEAFPRYREARAKAAEEHGKTQAAMPPDKASD